MNAGLGWIDFSKEHRDILKSVLDSLKQSGVVDELGIGSVRNSISDLLFPGINTIQTRAKYYILISQVIQEYETKFYKNEKKLPILKDYLRKRENEIMRALAGKYPEGKGIIGINVAKHNGELARKPSSIYWNGIRKHNIIQTQHSLTEYLNRFKRPMSVADIIGNKDEEHDDKNADFNDLFRIRLPHQLGVVNTEDISIELTKEEAEFLRDQFKDKKNKGANNLLSELMKEEATMLEFISCQNYREMARKFRGKNIPTSTTKNIELGEQFDFIIHGAHIRYNYLLHQTDEQSKNNYKDKWDKWLVDVNTRIDMIRRFDVEYLLVNVSTNTKQSTKDFIRKWIREISNSKINTANIDNLIITQEHKNKGKLARLSMENPEPVENWIGMGKEEESLNYRFYNTRTIVEDIYNGIKQ